LTYTVYSQRHVILHLLAKFRSYPTIVGGVMSSIFQDGDHRVRNLPPG